MGATGAEYRTRDDSAERCLFGETAEARAWIILSYHGYNWMKDQETRSATATGTSGSLRGSLVLGGVGSAGGWLTRQMGCGTWEVQLSTGGWLGSLVWTGDGDGNCHGRVGIVLPWELLQDEEDGDRRDRAETALNSPRILLRYCQRLSGAVSSSGVFHHGDQSLDP